MSVLVYDPVEVRWKVVDADDGFPRKICRYGVCLSAERQAMGSNYREFFEKETS